MIINLFSLSALIISHRFTNEMIIHLDHFIGSPPFRKATPIVGVQ